MSAPEAAREHPYEPEQGHVVKDSVGRVGRVMGHEGPYYQLRPLQGGREWEAAACTLRLATRAEVLSATVDAVNEQERRGEIP